MVWLMMMGSGCCRSPASFMGISEKRMRTQLKIWGAEQSLWHLWQGLPSPVHQVGHPQAGGASQSPGKGHKQSLEGLWEAGMRRYLAEVAVAVDELLLVAVLQFVVFDVEPQGLHDAGPGLGVHPQQPRQSRVQLVLGGLRGQPGSGMEPARAEKPSRSRAQPLTHPHPDSQPGALRALLVLGQKGRGPHPSLDSLSQFLTPFPWRNSS